VTSLYDMQHSWYELAAARAHLGEGTAGRGPALKKFMAVVQHYKVIVGEDVGGAAIRTWAAPRSEPG
jgi:hypothetical protein